MKESPYKLDIYEDEESFNLKEAVSKYLRYWPWFLIALLITFGIGFAYLRYAPIIYETQAKIKILDDTKGMKFSTDPMSMLSGQTKINTDNEIEVLESYRILSQAVEKLNLDVSYFVVGNIKTTQIWDAPFVVTKQFSSDSLTKPVAYIIRVNSAGFVVQAEDENTVAKDGSTILKEYPFALAPVGDIDVKTYGNTTYKVILSPVKDVVLKLIKDIEVQSTNKNSEIISMSIKGENYLINEEILNTIINIFNKDGILDRQLVSKRTVDFIDERFVFLSGELDSIEGNKQAFKQSNSLSYIEADAGETLQKKSMAEDQVFSLQTQLSLSELLNETLSSEDDYTLLPADIGLESSSVNKLVTNYNQIVLEREKLRSSAGSNNPTLQGLSSQLKQGKKNIEQTVNMYQEQLKMTMGQLNQQKNRAGAVFSRIPQKEKILRSIERQQTIKEKLFLLLLEKREEAAVNFAVTAPSIKVVDYGLSSLKPVSPKKSLVYAVSLLLGLILPFGFLYMRFTMDTKVHDRFDIQKVNPEIPVLTEIPTFEDKKNFTDANDHSILAEAFRILSTNVNYILPKKEKGVGQVIYVTSTVKEEGKTLVALNLSLAYSSLKKRVLLVGADLRNPQLHTYFKIDKNSKGLSNYLYDQEIDWKECISDGFNINEFHKVCFSGTIPPNAPELLSSNAFKTFIENAKQEYDYVIVDTAPTLLVTDTMLISQYADATLFVVRAGQTEKRLLDFSKNLKKTKKLKNMVYVVNDVKIDKAQGYNYGYGYGYSAKAETTPWYKRYKKTKK